MPRSKYTKPSGVPGASDNLLEGKGSMNIMQCVLSLSVQISKKNVSVNFEMKFRNNVYFDIEQN